MADDWSIKRLHRRVMLSSTYRQHSQERADGRTLDPENTLYWRMNRRRLDFEATRNALLAVSGRLRGVIGGPPMPSLTGTASDRRTLYGFIDRLNLPGVYRTFDFPDPTTTSPRRDQTTVAPQALFLMNHPFVIDAARGLLSRPEIAAESQVDSRSGNSIAGSTAARRVTRTWRWLERSWAATAATPVAGNPLGRRLLMANEFVFVD